MTSTVTWIDRLRIERAVWTLDQRLYELPHSSRVAKRREVRQNLRAAASDVGARAALARLGDSHTLAAEYLSAELGDGPRPSWIAATLFFLTRQLLMTSVLSEAANAFGRGVAAADPGATGTFTWHGIAYLQSTVTYTFTNGSYDFVGGAWTPFGYVLWFVSAVCIGRLWRAIPIWRRRRAARGASASA
jgi:hypothetical protein